MIKRTNLSADYLRSIFNYDELSGKLTWAIDRPHRKIGDIAGCLDKCGYMGVSIMDSRYLVHRIIWAMIHGTYPENEIDHINGIRSDNRITNLRSVTRRENMLNLTSHRSGRLFGCTKHRGRWDARIWIGSIHKHIGTFATEQEAHEAYIEASKVMK